MCTPAPPLDLADALDAELARDDGAAHRLLAEVELPLSDGAGRDGARRHRRRHRSPRRPGGALRGRGEGGRPGGVRGGRAGVQPRLAQAAAGDPVRRARLPKTKRIKSGYTTDADSLQSLFAQTGHPLLEHLLRHRDVAKLKTTVDGLLKTVADDGRIHTTFNQTVAATGRLSSTDPNLQNIPIRTEEGRRIRRAFVVGEGYEHAADRRLQPDRDADHGAPVRRRGADRRRSTPATTSTPRPRPGSSQSRSTRSSAELRRKIKAMNYGLAYGLSAFGLAQQLASPPKRPAG